MGLRACRSAPRRPRPAVVNLAAVVWRRLLRERWVPAWAAGSRSSASTPAPPGRRRGQGEVGISSRFKTTISPFCGKCSLIGQSSGPSNQRRNSGQRLRVCGCRAAVTSRSGHRAAALQRSRAAQRAASPAGRVPDLCKAGAEHLELCWARCRTSSQRVQHENTYRGSTAKHGYGESPPELFPA